MYHTIVRALIRRSIAQLNSGNAEPLLQMASPDAVIVFPGDNSWATMFRPFERGRAAHATHRGLDECRAFADRFVAEGIQFHLEDVVVSGGPWRTRVVLVGHDYIAGDDGDEYNNRFAAYLEVRWGRLHLWEDFEDTERTADWDRRRAEAAAVER